MPVITTYRSRQTLGINNAHVCAKIAELLQDIPAGLGQGNNALLDLYVAGGRVYVHIDDTIQDQTLMDYYDIDKVSQ